MAEAARHPDRFQQVLVHTGQHYDYNMSQVFFEQLEMGTPDEFLNVGSGSHAVQTAAVMTAFEPVLLKHRPDWVLVVGDVNSTLACALVCSKLGVRVAHVEAGLRSRDRTMPEEINRLLTDRISNLLLTPSRDADANLLQEGADPAAIRCVGNVMIDTLVKMLPKAQQRPTLRQFGLEPSRYVLATLHRPSNVDEPAVLSGILQALMELSHSIPVVFPVHPRTRARIEELDVPLGKSKVRLTDPLGYLEFMALMASARLVITDSGGVQEETTYLGVPCLTARPSTERPITITEGTNRLIASDYQSLRQGFQEALCRAPGAGRKPELWDGQAASRIVAELWERGLGA